MVRRETEDSRSKGIVDTRNRLKGQTITVHVALTRGEQQDLLAFLESLTEISQP
jgi:hypothetical protein